MSTRNINPVQALFVFEHFHLRHSYGKTICHSCRNFVIEHIDAAKVKQHEKAFEWLADIADSDDEDKDNYKVSDSSYISSPSVASISSSSKEDKNSLDVRRKKREALNRFLELCGSNKVVKTTGSYQKLQAQSKANFFLSTRTLIQSILDFLAEDDSPQLRRELVRDAKGTLSDTIVVFI